MAEQQYNPTNDALADISVKLRDIEEKQNIIKDRVLLIGDNLISEKEGMNVEVQELKTKIAVLTEDNRKIKLAIERIIDDNNNLVRRNEFQILQRQFEMFAPLELARISDVEEMIEKALKFKK
jgi:hypothetical protein